MRVEPHRVYSCFWRLPSLVQCQVQCLALNLTYRSTCHSSLVFIAEWYSVVGFPGGSARKNLSANAGDAGSIPGSGRSAGEVGGDPLWCSCLGSLMDGGAWRAIVHGGLRVRHDLAAKQQQTSIPLCGQATSGCSVPLLVAVRVFVACEGLLWVKLPAAGGLQGWAWLSWPSSF